MKPDTRTGVIIGIAGAAGDGLDKTGDTLARTASRLGLYVYAYNSYQSIIRGGHTWLRIRLAEEKVTSHGDHLHALIILNQDSMERHASEVKSGGVIFYNSEKIQCDRKKLGLAKDVVCQGLPVGELTKPFGRIKPVMQNSIMLGAMLYWLGLDFRVTESVLGDTFAHKGQDVIDQNTGIARAGYRYTKENELGRPDLSWNYSRIRRPFITGNEAIAMGAAAAGLKFYAAYPMTPASTILHWLVAHGEKVGIMVKQVEDELAAINMSIGAGLAGARAMCGTSGGGFALMTEAVGLAGMLEAPVVVVNAQRGGPSTGLPTKTGQGDLYQVLGASQGDYPRIIIAPTDTTDAYYSAVEALNLAEVYQCPVIILSDLLLSEHPETIEPDALTSNVEIDRGKLLDDAPEGYLRYAMTADGISPRVLPGTPGTAFVAASDEHDEAGNVISDQFTNAPLRRKMHEKRMRKMASVLPRLVPPELEGPAGAGATLVGWGSTRGVIREAIDLLAKKGITANHLQIKYITPFHSNQVRRILAGCSRVVVVENNISGQFARYLRSQTGIQATAQILKYDGEPFTPAFIMDRVEAILEGKTPSLQLTEADAREIAYHYIRIYLNDAGRPVEFKRDLLEDYDEAVWEIVIVERESSGRMGILLVGAETGATLLWKPGE
ncbi:MAG: 2-oxoacid:acceptor oxidoreductase subunit alpha [Anaerolineales bacterium]|nr:2-oxoacid:acceptor oxidoreductase subunit alpha [Anaerolineales bacterium]